MWQIRKLEEIEALRKARAAKGWRIFKIVVVAISWAIVLVRFVERGQFNPKDFAVLALMLAVAPFLFLVLLFKPRLVRSRKPTVGMLCRKCEKMWYDEKQLVCSCGERLFRVDELKWVKDEYAEQAGNDDTQKDFSR